MSKNWQRITTRVSTLAICLAMCCAVHAADFPATITLTCVDDAAHGYATFQSHNQKVVSNKNGIFMTHIRTRNEAYTAQQWRLLRSTDGGKTFTKVFEATNATNPPVIETDAAANIYLIRADFVDNNAYLYRFLAADDYKNPAITSLPQGAAGKYAMAYDPAKPCLYYWAHNGMFFRIGMDGSVQFSKSIMKSGPHAELQYPSLFVDKGRLYAAWTTNALNAYLYWDIHHMVSDDGGESWTNLDGTKLALPIVADDTGAAARISLDTEYKVHTWLSNFTVNQGKVHFFYLAQDTPARENYVRWDVKSGKEDSRTAPRFGGKEMALVSLDGFFSLAPDGTLYATANDGGHIGCIRSKDNGTTWEDYARSDATFNPYAIGGCRWTTPDGDIIGAFTDSKGSNATLATDSKVYFLKISVKK